MALVDEIPSEGLSRKILGRRLVVGRDSHGDHRLWPEGDPSAPLPCQDRNGLVFGYLGAAETPSLGDFDCFLAPESHARVGAGSARRPWSEALAAELAARAGPASESASVERTRSGLRVVTRSDVPDVGLRVTSLLFPNAIVLPIGEEAARAVWFIPAGPGDHHWFAISYAFASPASLDADDPVWSPHRRNASSHPVVIAARLRWLDAMIDLLEDRPPPMTVDGVSRLGFRGPVALERRADADARPWEEVELGRRGDSEWARYLDHRSWSWSGVR